MADTSVPSNGFGADSARRSSVSIIVLARTGQDDLNRCLAALDCQDPPPSEIIVVDSTEGVRLDQLQMRTRTTLLVCEPDTPAGSTRAYATEQAGGDVLIFIESDVVPAPGMVDACASGLDSDPTLVTIADERVVAKFDDAEFLAACRSGMFADYVGMLLERDPNRTSAADIDESSGGNSSAQESSIDDNYVDDSSIEESSVGGGSDAVRGSYTSGVDGGSKTSDGLAGPGLWSAVSGRGLAVSRRFYDYAGGFNDFEYPVDGIELGWRLLQSGGVMRRQATALVPSMNDAVVTDPEESLAHVMADTIPHRSFRSPPGGPWRVPKVVAQVLVGDSTPNYLVSITCRGLLSSTEKDIHIDVYLPDDMPDRDHLRAFLSAQTRVTFIYDGKRLDPISSPFIFRLIAGVELSADTLALCLDRFDRDDRLGVIGVIIDDGLVIECWRNEAYSRAQFISSHTDLTQREALRASFREEWLGGHSIGAVRARSAATAGGGRMEGGSHG